ncbi:MAG: tetratricopeptide repeat protein [Niastella sp.]|nr:tetratricopeptide repeat protein [Niastella sp.]
MIRQFIIATCISTLAVAAQAQTENKSIRSGNKLYKEGKYDQAQPEYEKAITQNPNNPVGRFNLGNAQFRKEDFAASEKNYDEAATASKTDDIKQKSLYNKGVSLSKQKKLQESIDTYKKSLRLNPQDQDTRYNLEKALAELKKQNEAEDKKKQQQQQQQDQKKQQQKQPPKPQPRNNLDKKKIEQFLKSLEQKEQEVQRKMQQSRTPAAGQQEKDW